MTPLTLVTSRIDPFSTQEIESLLLAQEARIEITQNLQSLAQ